MTKHYLIPSALKSVYFCLVYIHLQYVIGAWASVPKTTLNQLNVLHKAYLFLIPKTIHIERYTPVKYIFITAFICHES